MNRDIKAVITAVSDDGQKASWVLADIGGKPLIQQIFESAAQAGVDQVVIATDSPRIGMVCEDFGATVCMLVDEKYHGLERLAEVADRMGWGDQDILVNVPVDAPLIPKEVITQVASNLVNNEDADGAVLFSLVTREAALLADSINMVVDNSSCVMYLSHHAIPHIDHQPSGDIQYRQYLGLSAYSVGLLRAINSMSAEQVDVVEGIDELKLLYNGMKIHAEESSRKVGFRVHNDDDLEVLKQQLATLA